MNVRSLACCLIVPLLASISTGLAAAGDNDWSQWRGPDRQGIAAESGLLKQWPEGGPGVVWQNDSVGVGYSSLVISDGRIFTQGDLGGVEHVIAIDAETGKRLWAVQPAPVAEALAQRIDGEFSKADRNGDGKIDEVEALTQFGTNFYKYDQSSDTNKVAADRRAANLLKALDENNDQSLSFAEAGNLLRDMFERIDQEDKQADADTLAADRAAATLKALDADNDGKISREESRRSELDRSFNQADERDPNTNKGDDQLTAEELKTYFAKRQTGKDGVLTAAELESYYARDHAGRDGILTREELQGLYGGYRNGQGDGPRGTPIVEGDRLYTEGGNGDVTCFDAATGKTIWHLNLVQDLGGGRPGWGYSESPLIEGDLLIVTPGGKQGTLAALNKKTGEVVWRSEEVTEGAHYSSPVAATIAGVRQIVQFARGSVFGVDSANGKFLWKYSAAANGTANCFTPIVDNDHVFVSSAYGTGSGLAKVSGTSQEQTAEEVYFLAKLQSHHGGAVKIGDYLYSNGGGTIMCVNFLTGEIAWQARGVGKGSLVAADGMLYLLGERHEAELVEATPEEYRSAGQFKIENHGRPSWAHPVVAGGRLYIRNQHSLTAYDVTAK